ncbi:transcription elongation factor SPT4 isoform X2 [Cimex lectularius]|uniref:Transcription elongation factor SPT4 n=1 Tax=Cimex lectularius TaxID=79782 RepID=A0A8I6R7Y5_CIMLE|nr:transcription elongation factor SPT4 isoform X2 [Cimex lectularius]
MSLNNIVKDLRTARACLVCSLIKNFEQFEFDGCDNCEEFLKLKNNRENIIECTSSNFNGIIAVMSPQDSWVAKWQDRFTRGIYAISVAGKLPHNVIRDMKSRGITYRIRDTSQK